MGYLESFISSPRKTSFVFALGQAVYCLVVALIFFIAQDFEVISENDWLPMIFFLLLFVFSAAVSGILVFGLPLYLIIRGEKELGLKILFQTLGWLVLFLLVVFIILFSLFN